MTPLPSGFTIVLLADKMSSVSAKSASVSAGSSRVRVVWGGKELPGKGGEPLPGGGRGCGRRRSGCPESLGATGRVEYTAGCLTAPAAVIICGQRPLQGLRRAAGEAVEKPRPAERGGELPVSPVGAYRAGAQRPLQKLRRTSAARVEKPGRKENPLVGQSPGPS